jgi:hypothetical protein
MLPGHECPAPGCGRRLNMGQFACSEHWHALPGELRRGILAAWSQRARALAQYGAARHGAEKIRRRSAYQEAVNAHEAAKAAALTYLCGSLETASPDSDTAAPGEEGRE